MKVKEVFEKSVNFFRERNIYNPRFEVELLLASVLKTDRIGVYLKYEAPLTEMETNSLRELVVRKSKGEPTAYLIGEKFFYGRSYEVGTGVLIPRPETEQIVEEAQSFLKQTKFESIKIADLGSGTGCLGITLGLEEPTSEVTMIEKSIQAYQYTQKNLKNLVDNENQHRFKIINQAIEDLYPSQQFHLIVANPPYIAEEDPEIDQNVKAFEPHEALFAEDKGLSAISSWLNFVVASLKPRGACFFEMGYKQGRDVMELFRSKNCFQSIDLIQDFNQRDRIIKAVKHG
jgi:release factor glutamine methyltransferase